MNCLTFAPMDAPVSSWFQFARHPAAWALPVSEVQRALEHFITHGEPAAWLTWHNDSEDGVAIGHAAA